MTESMYVDVPSYAARGGPPEVVKDFSTTSEAILFGVDGELFEAVSELPAVDTLRIGDLIDQFDRATSHREHVDVMSQLVRILLTSESAERFLGRLASRERPIGLVRLTQIVRWLLVSDLEVATAELAETNTSTDDEGETP